MFYHNKLPYYNLKGESTPFRKILVHLSKQYCLVFVIEISALEPFMLIIAGNI